MKGHNEEDVVLRLLHTADWHLGRRFPSFLSEDDEKKLTRARVDVLERIFGLAERHDVHAVLCAGDLFDEPQPSSDWWEPLAAMLAKKSWANRTVFLLPGNHDPLLADSIWAKDSRFRVALPPWVRVVDEDLLEHALPGDAVLYAAPCKSRSGQNDPTQRIPVRAPGDERIRIGMVHGSTFDLAHCQTHFPISKDAAVEWGLDYLAIGDTHGFRFVPPDRMEPPTVYPGAPEPTTFDEKDAGHVALVHVTRRRRVRVDRERVAKWTWEEAEVRSIEELRALCSRADLAGRVMRLRVDMSVTAPDYAEAERLLEDLVGTAAKHGRVGVLQLDREGLALDVDGGAQLWGDLPDVLQSAARRLQTQASEPDPERAAVARRALYHLYQVSRKAS